MRCARYYYLFIWPAQDFPKILEAADTENNSLFSQFVSQRSGSATAREVNMLKKRYIRFHRDSLVMWQKEHLQVNEWMATSRRLKEFQQFPLHFLNKWTTIGLNRVSRTTKESWRTVSLENDEVPTHRESRRPNSLADIRLVSPMMLPYDGRRW